LIQHHRTKIVGTLGPATDGPGVLRECIQAGMNIARLNAAHGTDQEKVRRVQALRRAAKELGLPVGLLVDLPGPKFRLGNLAGGQRELRRGEIVTIGPSEGFDDDALPIRDVRILSSIAAGHLLHLADGTVTLRIVKRSNKTVKGQVIIGGVIRSGSGINIPNTDIGIKIPTASDLHGIHFAAVQKAEWIGVSFVRTPQDISRVRRAFSRFRHTPRIIAKIEKPQALENLDAILGEADGLMVARGDLGVETPLEQVPLAKKKIISRANEMGKPVITATQMLESMVAHRWPTRAEVADVANAVLDGTDAVMLSAETAIGQYPAEAVQMLRAVIAATETVYPFQTVLDTRVQKKQALPEDAIRRSACRLAWDAEAKAIVISSHLADLPYSVSRFRPIMPIIVLASDLSYSRQLVLNWGVQPICIAEPFNESLEPARRWLFENRMARSGNHVVWIYSLTKGKDETVHAMQLSKLQRELFPLSKARQNSNKRKRIVLFEKSLAESWPYGHPILAEELCKRRQGSISVMY
jgi:pyruvate kinase